MGFSRLEYWSGLPFPSLGDLPSPGIEPKSPASPALQAILLLLSHPGRSQRVDSENFSHIPHVWVYVPNSSVGKEPACNAGDPGSIPGSGRSAGEGIGYPLQCSWASLVAQLVKNPLAMQDTWV